MSIIDNLIGVLAPYECLGCSQEGRLLCPDCTKLLNTVPDRCYRCRKVSVGARTCSSCRRVSTLQAVHIYTDYDFVAKELIWRLKFTGAQAGGLEMGISMASLISPAEKALIVPVPTATGRARQRGYDQAKLIARQIARRLELPYVDCLARSGQSHQVGSSRRQRLVQLNSAFRVKLLADVRSATIILVDDVITTGATLEAAAKALRLAGAGKIEAVVFAQA